MTIRKSQAFAAFRSEVIAQLQANITEELVPHFNAEVNDIRVKHEELKRSNEALADHQKRARILDLKVRQKEFLDGLNKELEERLSKRVTEYGGTVEKKTITSDDGKAKEVLEALFDDGSNARVPRALWVDYSVFQRA